MRWIAVVAVVLTLGACASQSARVHRAAPISGLSTPAGAPSTKQIAGRPAPEQAPVGTRPVTYHGLTIFVPASWATNAVKCGAPLKNTVFFDDAAQNSCGSFGTTPFSWARFRYWRPGDASDAPSRRTLTIDGHRAFVHARHSNGNYLTELVVPDISAMVAINSPQPTLGGRLVNTAEITQTDANGCASTMGYIDLTALPTSGPVQAMVVGHPSSVAICTYLRTYLEYGVTLSATDANRLVATLNALPTGLSVASPKYYLPSLCRGPDKRGDDMDSGDYSIRVSYPDAPLAVVYARLSLCGALGFSNGTRTGQRTTPMTELLVSLSGFNTTWQGGVHPRA